MLLRLRMSLVMLGFFVLAVSQNNVFGQTPVLGGLVETHNYYNGYGAGTYGGGTYGGGYGPEERFFGRGYGGGYGPYDFSYSGYGNGPYGAGSGNEHEFLSTNRYVPEAAIYDGYGYDDYFRQPPIRRYNPYGFGVPKSHHYAW